MGIYSQRASPQWVLERLGERERERERTDERQWQCTTWFTCCEWDCRPIILKAQNQTETEERRRGKLSRQKKKTGSESATSDRETQRQREIESERGDCGDGERAARHAGRLSVSGLWECGKDTVVGRVPALKLESGAKRREPEPKAVWELPGAASPAHCPNMIYCWAALQTAHRSWCAISLAAAHHSLHAIEFTTL